MQSIFFIIFVYKLDWKKAAEEVCTFIHWRIKVQLCLEIYLKLEPAIKNCLTNQALVRAGVKSKEEKEMVRMENTGKARSTTWNILLWQNYIILKVILSNLQTPIRTRLSLALLHPVVRVLWKTIHTRRYKFQTRINPRPQRLEMFCQ